MINIVVLIPKNKGIQNIKPHYLLFQNCRKNIGRNMGTLRILIEKQMRRSKLFNILKRIAIKYYDRKCIYKLYKNLTVINRWKDRSG